MHPSDVDVVATRPASELATAVREALVSPEGYLRDVAVTFRPSTFHPEQVQSPTWAEYGALDPQVSVRNGRWLAATLADHCDELLGRLRGTGSAETEVRRPSEG